MKLFKIKIAFLVVVSALVLIFSGFQTAYADLICPPNTASNGSICLPTNSPTGIGGYSMTLSDFILLIINIMLAFASLFAIAFIIYGGYLYIFDGGSDANAKKGKKVLVNAIIGLVIIILCYTIVAVVSNTVSSLGSGGGWF